MKNDETSRLTWIDIRFGLIGTIIFVIVLYLVSKILFTGL